MIAPTPNKSVEKWLHPRSTHTCFHCSLFLSVAICLIKSSSKVIEECKIFFTFHFDMLYPHDALNFHLLHILQDTAKNFLKVLVPSINGLQLKPSGLSLNHVALPKNMFYLQTLIAICVKHTKAPLVLLYDQDFHLLGLRFVELSKKNFDIAHFKKNFNN